MADVLKVSDTSTRAEIAEMIQRVRLAQKRAPACMVDRMHARLDVLLEAWREADA